MQSSPTKRNLNDFSFLTNCWDIVIPVLKPRFLLKTLLFSTQLSFDFMSYKYYAPNKGPTGKFLNYIDGFYLDEAFLIRQEV